MQSMSREIQTSSVGQVCSAGVVSSKPSSNQNRQFSHVEYVKGNTVIVEAVVALQCAPAFCWCWKVAETVLLSSVRAPIKHCRCL